MGDLFLQSAVIDKIVKVIRYAMIGLGRPRRNGKSPGRKTVPWETIAWENSCLGNRLPTLPRTNRYRAKIGVWGRPIQHNRMQL